MYSIIKTICLCTMLLFLQFVLLYNFIILIIINFYYNYEKSVQSERNVQVLCRKI